MRVGECRNLAENWAARREACLPGYVGAYLGGSTAALPPDAPMPGGSDLDVYVALEGPLPEKRGKFEYQGALLEVSYVSWAAIFPAERALKDYHLAYSLRYGQVAGDPRGRLRPLMEQVARHFWDRPYWTARRDQALEKVRAGLTGLRPDAPLPDKTLSWLFPTGITTHTVLTAAGENPTVRLRYLRARRVLEDRGRLDVYERLLALSGFARVTGETARKMLDELAPAFDAAARLGRTPFFFSSDISPVSRPAAIDDLAALIARGFHRETLFWIVCTWARSMKILAADAPEEYARFLPLFRQALAAVDRDTDEKISAAAGEVLAYLPALRAVTDEIMKESAH